MVLLSLFLIVIFPGDHPPKDRGSLIRSFGFSSRNLGTRQMTTDTAALTVHLVIDQQRPLSSLRFVDDCEIPLSKIESIKLPFRFVVADDAKTDIHHDHDQQPRLSDDAKNPDHPPQPQPILAPGLIEFWKNDEWALDLMGDAPLQLDLTEEDQRQFFDDDQ